MKNCDVEANITIEDQTEDKQTAPFSYERDVCEDLCVWMWGTDFGTGQKRKQQRCGREGKRTRQAGRKCKTIFTRVHNEEENWINWTCD